MRARNCLLVDDDPIAVAYCRDLLGARGFCFEHAPTLAAADVVLAQRTPDLLVVDRRLPDGDGLAWLAARLQSARAAPRCLVCSGDAIPADALPDGVRALRKPVDADALLGWALDACTETGPAAAVAARSLALLDDEVAARKFGGNLEALRTLRRMFAAELASADSQAALAGPGRADLLHRWRAACALTGCPALGVACAGLEEALQRGDPDLASQLKELARTIQATRTAIGA